MGCDIHFRVQKRQTSESPWEFAEARIPDTWNEGSLTHENWYTDRCYDCFAILANVRNGSGFAGCDTGDEFRFISEPRGLPDDLAYDDNDDFGDHSQSWLSLRELNDFDWYQENIKRGWLTGPQFESLLYSRQYDNRARPDRWCSDASGPMVTHITEQQMTWEIEAIKARIVAKIAPDISKPTWRPDFLKQIDADLSNTYAVASWPIRYSEAATDFYTLTMPRLNQLAKQTGGQDNVRIVFGFDS